MRKNVKIFPSTVFLTKISHIADKASPTAYDDENLAETAAFWMMNSNIVNDAIYKSPISAIMRRLC